LEVSGTGFIQTRDLSVTQPTAQTLVVNLVLNLINTQKVTMQISLKPSLKLWL